MYENILIPTDGSKGVEKAVDHAINMAKKFDSKIHALYVMDVRMVRRGSFYNAAIGEYGEEGRKATEKIVEKAREQDVKAVKGIKKGVPHRSILEYSDKNSIDLITMGTHGRTGLDRFLIGSTTEKVVRTSNIPVLTVRMSEEDMKE